MAKHGKVEKQARYEPYTDGKRRGTKLYLDRFYYDEDGNLIKKKSRFLRTLKNFVKQGVKPVPDKKG